MPFFTRDFSPLIAQLEIKTFPADAKIFDFKTVPTNFYVIKRGRVKFEDERIFKLEKESLKKDPRA